MLFVVQLAAMNGEERVLDALDAILVRVEDDVHEAELIDVDELEASAWYQSSRRDRQKLLEKIAEASLHRSPRKRGPHLRRVEVSDPATAAQARVIAHAPLLVLVENDISDGSLVEAALRTLAEPATIELCFGAPSQLEPPAFKMESRGGHGELKKLIVSCIKDAAARGRRPRMVVITDSDGEWPGEVKSHAQEIRTDCARHGIPCPPLNKRTAENYIPDAVWHAWVSDPDKTAAKPMVEALLRLSREQRDHVNMARPDQSPWDKNKPKAVALFQGVSTADEDILRRSNLKGRSDSMLILALKVHANALTSIDLQARDHQGDLLNLVRNIEDEL
ncbi:uncharacterized protein SOCE26_080120 [Sorangium cellulosum]|uniref:Uncharacterized protein n=1 Tax=Sorangium cellulosum TaxID=56 RepID=A0A2L0F4N9_SORCE|nr:hypothetical protein [Sorangium cellulosum]AUX46506.1 uncharacterized protein SOCE26_080120 [Sorangium cellulosum]